MPVIALLIALGGVVGLVFAVKEIHEVVEEPVFPLIGLGLGLVALMFLVKAVKE